MNANHADDSPAVRIEGLTKAFPGTLALDHVDLEIRRGEVHALVGHNGSGKSTLIKTLAGLHHQDEGTISILGGPPREIGSTAVARELGLRFVHQDLGMIEQLSAVENLALGRGFETGFAGRIRWSREVAAAQRRLAELGYRIDVRRPVGELSAAQQAGLAIARAISDWEKACLLVVDEPTAALPRAETQGLFDAIDRARGKGLGVLYVSHRLEEVFLISDRVTVLRDGKKVGTRLTSDLDKDELIEMMLGGEQLAAHAKRRTDRNRSGMLVAKELSGAVIKDLDIDVAGGEVVGVAGLTGSGREELLRLIFGAQPREGEVHIDGDLLKPDDPRAAMRSGVSMVPADRHGDGSIEPLSVRFNMTLTDLGRNTNRFGAVRGRKERAEVKEWVERLDIKPPRVDNDFPLLSGGNQQKVVMAKWLRLKPKVLLLDEPTQGVDVHSKAVLHNLAREAASDGAAVVIASSDDEELVDVCDRVIILRDGRIAGELEDPAMSLDAISRMEIDFSAEEDSYRQPVEQPLPPGADRPS
jgi:ribose transport system ATP-binding protein